MSTQAAVFVTKMQIRSIYKLLLREAQKIPSYNFRNYAQRRIRDAFLENRNLSDPAQIQREFEYAKRNLNIIQRQAIVGRIYDTEKLVIEKAANRS